MSLMSQGGGARKIEGPAKRMKCARAGGGESCVHGRWKWYRSDGLDGREKRRAGNEMAIEH